MPIKVKVLAHFPWELLENNPRCDVYDMEVEATEPVSTFKSRLSELSGLDSQMLTVMCHGQLRNNNDVLWLDGDLQALEGMDTVYLHVRVENAELNRRVEEYLASKCSTDIFLPLDQVKMKEE